MAKIKSLDELKKIRDDLKKNIEIRENSDSESTIKITVGMATCGIAAGAREAFKAIQEEADNQGIKNIVLVQSGCMGSCYAEPTVEVQFPGQESILYGNVTPDKAKDIVIKHIKNGELLQNLIIGKPFEKI
jgi:NADP-reducing hydrogenase subunit HndB